MKIEVSNGELLDKYTILSIKLQAIKDEAKLKNVSREFVELTQHVDELYRTCKDTMMLQKLHQTLQNINITLWNVEDQIREQERQETFGKDFIELARTVYYVNDERAEVKRSINELTESALVEEKSYQAY